jgi:hypothetical protein
MAHDPVACAVVSIVFAVVACVVLGVRFFVRLGLQNRIFLDDILSAVATVRLYMDLLLPPILTLADHLHCPVRSIYHRRVPRWSWKA